MTGSSLRERALLDELLAQALVLRLGAVAPDDPVGLGEGGDLVDPGDQLLVLGRGWWEPHCRAPRSLRRSAGYCDGFRPLMPESAGFDCRPLGAATRMLRDRSSGADRTHLIIRAGAAICPEGTSVTITTRGTESVTYGGVGSMTGMTRRARRTADDAHRARRAVRRRPPAAVAAAGRPPASSRSCAAGCTPGCSPPSSSPGSC